MKLQKIFSILMKTSFGKTAFQVFFHSNTLENELQQSSQSLKRVIEKHLMFSLLWYLLSFLILHFSYELFGLAEDDYTKWSIPLGLFPLISLYTVLMTFFWGGVFKRDYILRFIVGTYWSFVICLFFLLLLYLFPNIRNHSIMSTVLFLVTGLICALAGMYGQERSNPFIIPFQAIFQPEESEKALRQSPPVKYLFITLVHLVLLLTVVVVDILVVYFFLLPEIKKALPSFPEDEFFFVIFFIAFLSISGWIVAYFFGLFFFRKDVTFILIVGTYWGIVTSTIIIVVLRFFYTFFPSGQLLGIDSSINLIISMILFEALIIIIANLYGKPLNFKLVFYGVFILSFLGLISVGILINDAYFTSLYLFLKALTLDFGISLCIFCFGLYRVPVYFVEIFLHIWSLKILTSRNSDVSKAIKMSPLFFDHILTLPLPFTKTFLQRIAERDKRLYITRLGYLIEKAFQQKFVAEKFYEFHEKHQEYWFKSLYKNFQTDERKLLHALTRQVENLNTKKKKTMMNLGFLPFFEKFQNRFKVGAKLYIPTYYKWFASYEVAPYFRQLIQSYNNLLTENFVKSSFESHANILKDFVDNNYLYAKELYLTYRVFSTLSSFESVEHIILADQALSDILKISYNELLNVQIIEKFSAIAEIANDLKNYMVVEIHRDKQYYLSETRIKLYEISRKIQDELHDPERKIFLKIIEKWQDIITTESKKLRAPAELDVSIASKTLINIHEWSPLVALVKNIGQSPAENVIISLLEYENMLVLENQKNIGLLGTEETKQVEFSIKPQGNPAELRMYFDVQFDDFERKNKLRPFADIVRLATETEEFRKVVNPYVAGTPVRSEKVFFGRRDALNFAVENLRGGEQNNVLIYFGQRRVGKSSILYRLQESSLKEHYLFAYIDCQGFGEVDTAGLFYRICNSIYREVKKIQSTLERPTRKKFIENPFGEFDEYLDKVESVLEEKQLVLLFDEYEFLEYKVKDGNVSPEIFNKLRNLMQHREKLAFIFAGTHRLTELTEDYWSILFNIALYHEIGQLDVEAAKALITEPVRGYLRYDELAIDKILRVTGLHPYFIQVTCRLIINHCNAQQTNFVTLALVNQILKDAVDGSTAHVKYLFKDYATEQEQEIMVFFGQKHRRKQNPCFG